MKKRKFIWVRIVSFLIILVISLSAINEILMPKYILKNSNWPTTSSYYQFYKMKRDTIDVLFLGASVVVNDFSPQAFYNDYGIRSYNLGSEQQSIFYSYFWLKEALRFQSPKVVVLDTLFLFDLHPDEITNTTEPLARKCLDPMKWSSVKREAISDLCEIDESQSEISYYLKNIRFHDRWDELSTNDFHKSCYTNSPLKGFGPLNVQDGSFYETYTFGGDYESKEPPQPVMLEYLDKIVELCKANDIQLILVTVPGNPMNGNYKMNDAYNNTLTSYAQENGIAYYNFSDEEIYNAINPEIPKENIVGHGNLWGAEKIDKYFGQILVNDFGVQGVTDEQYESTKPYYEHLFQAFEVRYIDDLNTYLQYINDEHYTIFVTFQNQNTMGMTEENQLFLKQLGLQEDLIKNNSFNYAAVISKKYGVDESLSIDSSVNLKGKIEDPSFPYSIVSASSDSSIILDGNEYCLKTDGMNIVVYDNELQKVIDAVSFNTNSWGEAIR